MNISTEIATRAVLEYNAGSYHGRRNIDVDREAYARFSSGVPDNENDLIELLTFAGDDYGGAQRRSLPQGFREEAALIVANLRPTLGAWRQAVRSVHPLGARSPSEGALDVLLGKFAGTQRWPVWASKTLHLFRPDAFPIFDPRAKKALGMSNLGGTPKDYARFCAAIHSTILDNVAAMHAARESDDGNSPSDIKLLDKILNHIGAQGGSAVDPTSGTSS